MSDFIDQFFIGQEKWTPNKKARVLKSQETKISQNCQESIKFDYSYRDI